MQHARDRERSVEAIRAFVGTPFFHRGRTRGGIDCVGLFVVQRAAVGLAPFVDPEYAPGICGDAMRAVLERFLVPIDPAAAELGDGLWMRVADDLPPSHIVIRSGPRRVIQSETSRGVVEHIFPASWMDRVVSAWRFPEWAI